ncbi:MAG: hypothetical protein ACRDYX_02830 [Egibacteraceae bacterium]
MEPNLFNLAGPDDLEITYSTTSFTGQPQFRYKDEKDDLSFSGDGIGVLVTKIGTLVTVTLKHVPDEKIVTFTLLLPNINLDDGEDVRFKTVGIKTTDRSSAFVVPGSLTGALQTYRTRKLDGVAEHVGF